MSSITLGIIGLIVLIILLFSRMWIGVSMAIVGFVGYALIIGLKPACAMIAQVPFSTVAHYPLSAVPLFIFMGILLFHTGVGAELYESAYAWVGRFRGGLAMASVLACALFAAITGISAPAVVTMGKVAVPEMRKYKYDDKLATGSIACAGTMSILIPPSMAFIIFGILTSVPVGKLFIGGILPGIILSIMFIITISVITLRNPEAGPAGAKTTFKEKVVSLKKTWPVVLLFIVILGGIYGGVFTPTEAGAVGTFIVIIISIIKKRLTFKILYESLLETGQTAAMVFFLMIGAYILMKFFTVSKLPYVLSQSITSLPIPPMAVMAGIGILYIVLGMFLDILSAIIITVPIIFPAVTALGFDPIWFGVIITMLVQIGLVTPPVGLDAFTLAGVIDVPIQTIFRGVLPFVVTMIICIIILMIFPQIILFLPQLM